MLDTHRLKMPRVGFVRGICFAPLTGESLFTLQQLLKVSLSQLLALHLYDRWLNSPCALMTYSKVHYEHFVAHKLAYLCQTPVKAEQ